MKYSKLVAIAMLTAPLLVSTQANAGEADYGFFVDVGDTAIIYRVHGDRYDRGRNYHDRHYDNRRHQKIIKPRHQRKYHDNHHRAAHYWHHKKWNSKYHGDHYRGDRRWHDKGWHRHGNYKHKHQAYGDGYRDGHRHGVRHEKRDRRH